MDWRLKAYVQTTLSHLPVGDWLHHLLQRWAGGLRGFDRECDAKVEDWGLMTKQLQAAGAEIPGARFLEIGTGWYPTLPLCLYLGGASRVHTLDVSRKLNRRLTRAMVQRLSRHLRTISETTGVPFHTVERAHKSLLVELERSSDLEGVTEGVVAYSAPADARHTSLTESSLDVVFSNSVLEHVPPDDIRACFAEARRLLRPDGVMFHAVNCGDHYAYADSRIGQLHYLGYSDREWRRWNNRFLYQNRLRAVDFTRLAREAGFVIESDTSRPTPERLAELAQVPVDRRFSGYSPEELAVTSIDFVARSDRLDTN
jgi:SAM-dependent methyltransferase